MLPTGYDVYDVEQVLVYLLHYFNLTPSILTCVQRQDF